MTTYKIAEQSEDHVYCVVTMDDGSTFGQMIHGVKDLPGITVAVEEAVARVKAAAPVGKMEEEVVLAFESKAELVVSEISDAKAIR